LAHRNRRPLRRRPDPHLRPRPNRLRRRTPLRKTLPLRRRLPKPPQTRHPLLLAPPGNANLPIGVPLFSSLRPPRLLPSVSALSFFFLYLLTSLPPLGLTLLPI